MLMELFLNPHDERSMTVQLYEQLRNAITDGRLPTGARLVPTRSVAQDLGVSRSTVTDAYARLTAEGYVEGRRGGGSFVAGSIQPQPREEDAEAALVPTPAAAAIRRYDEVRTTRLYGEDLPTRARFDLTPGRTDPQLFPTTTWRRCMARALWQFPGQYADPAGSSALRLALSRWITQSRGVTTSPEKVVVTNGAGHAVDLVARVLLAPGDVAAVEEPGYPPVTNTLRTHGVTVVGVPVDEQGIVVDAIPPGVKVVYVTPSHQYPLGVVMSRARRLELLRWARRQGAAVLEDDYDSEFRHTPRPLEPLHRLDRDGHVIYVGTFSKILSPGIRLGFAVVPRALLPTVKAVRRAVDWCPPAVTDAALTSFIDEGHLARHLRRARRVYRDRHRAVCRALTLLQIPRVTRLASQAGLHVTVLAPGMPPDDELVARASQRQLLIGSLRPTYQFGDPRPGVVVGFGALATEDVPIAIATLEDCLV
jgi:GntR family transcriptional regulator/MocR family aminotransferase